jgi:allophanate hydrolase
MSDAPQYLSLDLGSLASRYADGSLTPLAAISEVYRRLRARGDDHVWTYVVPEDAALQEAASLERRDKATLPLYGLPFSVKDNIHVAGLPTTAGCPAFAHVPTETATVVERARAAGAILVGKNTMDQFATGLVGIRSPGHPVNAFNPDYIPGGSSSGSAVAVAVGLVTFALGSDTGGSGRVPAALNNVVGLKPTPGILSAAGLVYANRSIDCVPIFALTCGDARAVFEALVGFDPRDPFMDGEPEPERGIGDLRIGTVAPNQLRFFGDDRARACHDAAIARLRDMGASVTTLDFAPFRAAGEMLFNGPFLAERLASVGAFIAANRHAVHPVVAGIIDTAGNYTAVDLAREYYRLRELRTVALAELRKVDVLALPTAGTIHRIAEVEADPVNLNATMGYYTYFANLLGLSAVAVPSAIREDGLPFGMCFYGGPRQDRTVLAVAERFQDAADFLWEPPDIGHRRRAALRRESGPGTVKKQRHPVWKRLA